MARMLVAVGLTKSVSSPSTVVSLLKAHLPVSNSYSTYSSRYSEPLQSLGPDAFQIGQVDK